MNKVEFIYNEDKYVVQCNKEDKMKDIINKFMNKLGKTLKNIFFLYNGQIINEELSFSRCANSLDRSRNYMNVLALESQSSNDTLECLIKSDYIICPVCGEHANISIVNFKITISGCKGGHETKNIQFNEFIKTQYIDQSKIKCDKCKCLKSETNENKFYTCYTCKLNLCPICYDSHGKSHVIKNYEENQFYCQQHFDSYLNYCTNCKKDICSLCEVEHKTHEIISYESKMPNIDNIRNSGLNDTKEKIYELKKVINGMIYQLNNLNKFLDTYFEIYNNIINNFNINKNNYFLIQNVNKINQYNDYFMGHITEIIKDNNLKSQFTNILKLYSKLDFKKFEKNIEIAKGHIGEIEGNIATNESLYHPSDDKYENFNINEIQELQSFTTNNKIHQILILNDRRILTHQDYFDERGNRLFKLCVYSTTNGFICDINIDTDDISDIYQMDDGNIIINGYNIQIVQIKKNTIEKIWEPEVKLSIKKRFLNNTFLIQRNENSEKAASVWEYLAKSKFNKILYKYNKGELIYYKNISDIYKSKVSNICQINENEYVLYVYQEDEINGESDILIFYDMKLDKKITTLKVGKGENLGEMFVFDQENLIISGNENIILIDIRNRKIKNEFQYDIYPNEFIYINEKIFLYKTDKQIFQYEFEDPNTIKLKGVKDIKNTLVSKYPGDKIIVSKSNKLTIYGKI